MQKTTYLLIVLIIMTMSFSLVRRKDFLVEADTGRQKDAKAERHEQAKRYFPTADYNEPDVPDSEENRTKKEKQKRFNNLMKWVSPTPQSHIVENLAVPEGLFNFPALPVKTSDIVIIGSLEAQKLIFLRTREMSSLNSWLPWKRYSRQVTRK